MSHPAPTRKIRGLIAVTSGLAMAGTTLAIGLPTAQAKPALAPDATIRFTGTSYVTSPSATCNNANAEYTITFRGTRNDGGGNDYFVVTTIDGNGSVQDVDSWDIQGGAPHFDYDDVDLGNVHPMAARPISVSIYDVDVDPNNPPAPPTLKSQAGYDWTRANGRLLSTDTIDPASISTAAVCSSLPMVKRTPVASASIGPARIIKRRTRPVATMAIGAIDGRRAPTGVVTVNVGRRTWLAPVSPGGAVVQLGKFRKPGRRVALVFYSGDAFTNPVATSVPFRVVKPRRHRR